MTAGAFLKRRVARRDRARTESDWLGRAAVGQISPSSTSSCRRRTGGGDQFVLALVR